MRKVQYVAKGGNSIDHFIASVVFYERYKFHAYLVNLTQANEWHKLLIQGM